MLFAGLLVFFGDGVVAGLPMRSGITGPAQLAAELTLACGLLMLFVPVLVTGDLEEEAIRKNWFPRRIFGEASLPSGLPLALLLTAIVIALTFAAGHYGPQAVRPSFMGRFSRAATFAVPSAQSDSVIRQAAGMLTAVVVGISGVGFLLSALLRNRWSALTLLYLALVFGVALPYFSYANLYGPDAAAAARNPAINSLYLCPFVPIREMTNALYVRPLFGYDSALFGMVGYGVWPLWVGTSLVYLAIGLVSYAAGLMVLRKKPLRPNSE